MEDRTKRDWHLRRCFGPFAFYDLHGKEDVPEGSASLVNRAEASFVLCIYTTMLKEVSGQGEQITEVEPNPASTLVLRGVVTEPKSELLPQLQITCSESHGIVGIGTPCCGSTV